MSKLLRISPQVALPVEAVTQTFAILGIRGSGKTNTGVVMMEEMLAHEQQCIGIDPTDAWYGIRSSKDGKSQGFEVIIMGGEHGDLPLEGTNGNIMAEFVVETGASVIFSLRHLSISDQRRFAQDFAEKLYDLKGKSANRTPLHIFVDEADEFVPQRIPHGFERMFGAYDRLVRRGRSSGIGLTLISQRAQVINKDVLSQCETLICHRVLHKLDRKALEAWIEAHDTAGQADAFMESLASLGKGEAWFWSPSWLDVFVKTQVRARNTFDSSFTPKAGEKPKTAVKLADVDLAALKERLAATIEKAKAEDPKELKKQIAELRKENAHLAKAKTPAGKVLVDDKKSAQRIAALTQGMEAAMKIIAEISAKGFDGAQIKQEEIEAAIHKASSEIIRLADSSFKQRNREFEALRARSERLLKQLSELLEKDVHLAVTVKRNEPFTMTSTRDTVPPKARVSRPVIEPTGDLTGAQMKILGALMEFKAIGRTAISKDWVAARANVSNTSGSFGQNLGALRERGLIEYPSRGVVAITEAGEVASGIQAVAPLSTSEMLASCLNVLTEAEGKILKVLFDVHPEAVAKDALANTVGVSPTSGSYGQNLGALRTAGMIEYPSKGFARCADWIFVDEYARAS